MKVDFDKSFRIQGCEVVNYLLEKSRVVVQSAMERNYHIFYQIISGSDPAERARLHLFEAQQYHYLDQSGCYEIPFVNDAKDYQEVMEALVTLQFTPAEKDSLQKIIAGILSLGNLVFEKIAGDAAEACVISPGSMQYLNACADLFGVEPDSLTFCLLGKMVCAWPVLSMACPQIYSFPYGALVSILFPSTPFPLSPPQVQVERYLVGC